MLGRITLQPLNLALFADAGGTANFSLLVPGTFNGLTDMSNGRYLKYIEVWTTAGTEGDRLHGLSIVDNDSILSGLGLSGLFPAYPTVLVFGDMDIVETSTLKSGLLLPPSEVIKVSKIDTRLPFDFIPAGMYLQGTFDSAAIVPLNKRCNINVYWGKVA